MIRGTTPPLRVYLESGRTWTFACAVDWPGWCRRGKGEEAAIEALLGYAERYRPVAGPGFPRRPDEVTVIGRLPGTATTDFGAPDARGPWDDEPAAPQNRRRLAAPLERSWALLDDVVAGAPATLRKGPRGGGRDRDAVADHVREAERSYARTIGVRLPPRTPWADQRSAIVNAVRTADVSQTRWPLRYAVRRIAWHVLDHAWEIEDRSE